MDTFSRTLDVFQETFNTTPWKFRYNISKILNREIFGTNAIRNERNNIDEKGYFDRQFYAHR